MRLAGFQLREAGDCLYLGPVESGDASGEVREAWELFKRNWELPAGMEPGSELPLEQLLARPFDAARHRIPLQSLAGSNAG